MVVHSEMLFRAFIAGGELNALQGNLLGDEVQRIIRAVPKRVREFTAGRTAARQALQHFGVEACAIATGSQGEPVWPKGYTGSITHSHSHAFAAVARLSDYRAIGIDLESFGRIQKDLWRLLFTPGEIEQLIVTSAESRARQTTRIFSAKEAAIKVGFALVGQRLDFSAMEVAWLDVGTFSVRLQHSPFGIDVLKGHACEDEEQVFTAIAIPA